MSEEAKLASAGGRWPKLTEVMWRKGLFQSVFADEYLKQPLYLLGNLACPDHSVLPVRTVQFPASCFPDQPLDFLGAQWLNTAEPLPEYGFDRQG